MQNSSQLKHCIYSSNKMYHKFVSSLKKWRLYIFHLQTRKHKLTKEHKNCTNSPHYTLIYTLPDLDVSQLKSHQNLEATNLQLKVWNPTIWTIKANMEIHRAAKPWVLTQEYTTLQATYVAIVKYHWCTKGLSLKMLPELTQEYYTSSYI